MEANPLYYAHNLYLNGVLVRDFVIPDGVTNVGNYLFSGGGIGSVTIPSSVTSIGNNAFTGCNSLKNVMITQYVCDRGMSAVFPDAYQFITNVVITDGATSIGSSMFVGCGGLVCVSIPNTVTNIGTSAFAGCGNLASMIIPDSVMKVGDGAFVGCTGIEVATMPACVKVASFDELYPDACQSVRRVIFAEGVTEIGDNFFSGGRGATALPDGVTVGCPNLESIDIAESVVRIGTNVFEACSALDMVVTNGLELYQGWCLGFAKGGGGRGATALPEGVRGIAAGAFEGEYDIESVVLPASLRFVGARAFKDCTELEEVSLPDGVSVVDRDAFRNCTYMQSVALPTNLVEIGDGAFANCAMLDEVAIPDGVLDVGEAAFSNCWRMTSAAIPASITNLGEGVFADCRRLTDVAVPIHIDTMAGLFPAAYDKIVNVRVVNGQVARSTSGDDSAAGTGCPPYQMVPGMFSGCTSLESVVWPNDGSVGAISEEAFMGCVNMTEFNLPTSITNIGARAFAGCTSIEEIELPENVAALGDEVFYGCSSLRAVHFTGNAPACTTAAYYGTDAALATYVVKDSMGWDGVTTSKSLPEFWPIGTTHEITWEPLVVAPPIVVLEGVGAVAMQDGMGQTSFSSDSCTVSLTCATAGATIYYGVNASPRPIARFVYSSPFTVSDTATIYAFAVKDGVTSTPVTKVTITKQSMMLGEAASADSASAALPWTTGGNANWTPTSDATASSGRSAQSGEIGDAAEGTWNESWIETTVSGAGTATFSWKVVCEEDYISHEATWDHVAFFTNGIEAARMDGDSGWRQMSVSFADAGDHMLRWKFSKDEYNEEEYTDRAWVTGFTWTPSSVSEEVSVDMGGGKSVAVPQTWIDAHPALVAAAGGDAATALQSTAANGRLSVVECYILGLDPESATNDFRITSFPMKADGTPDLDNLVFEPSQDKWNVPGAVPKLRGAATLDGPWQDVPTGGDTEMRFFKIEVVLP
jgi:hypothetical protein